MSYMTVDRVNQQQGLVCGIVVVMWCVVVLRNTFEVLARDILFFLYRLFFFQKSDSLIRGGQPRRTWCPSKKRCNESCQANEEKRFDDGLVTTKLL